MLRINIFLLLSIACILCKAQSHTIVFYNTENLFDTIDNPLKNDNEFLPNADKHWDSYKYYKKLTAIYKAIASCGQWQFPSIIGLCEVENKKCLEDLCLQTPLSKAEYGIVHYESEDTRGIDVALLYNPQAFTLLSSNIVRPQFKNPSTKSRDILYVSGLLGKDTLHLFVNHWPSRRGGQTATEQKRATLASLLKAKSDSILAINPNACIIAMGDFNDQANNSSLQTLSGSLTPLNTTKHSAPGSLKFRNAWQTFDLFAVSQKVPDRWNAQAYTISNADFFFVDDDKYLGKKPFRTYSGPRYLGGYSDHLPIYIQLNSQF